MSLWNPLSSSFIIRILSFSNNSSSFFFLYLDSLNASTTVINQAKVVVKSKYPKKKYAHTGKKKNVINAKHKRNEIIRAIKKALSKNFNNRIKNIKNPYGDGTSSKKIIKIISKLNLKKFNTQKKITY